MAPFAQQAFTAQPIPGGSLKLFKGVAEHLPLESASQDAVVATIVSIQGEVLVSVAAHLTRLQPSACRWAT